MLLDIQTQDVALAQAFDDLNGTKGTIGHHNSRVRLGVRRVGGPLSLFPSANDLAFFLPKILGGTPVGTAYGLAESPQSFSLWKVDEDAAIKYATCVVDSATFSSGQGQGLRLDLDIVAQDEDDSAAAATFPALALGETLADQPFVHTDSEGAATVNGVVYDVPDVTVAISWVIDRDAYRNRMTLAHLRPQDRVVTWSERVPGSWAVVRGLAGGAAVPLGVSYTNGAVSFGLASPLVRLDRRTPGGGGRGEVFYPITGRAYRSNAAPEISAVLDNIV